MESPITSDEPLIEPLLLIAISSTGAGITPKQRTGASQRIDVKAYKMAEHICPLFRFNACAHGSRPQGMHVQALSGRCNSLYSTNNWWCRFILIFIFSLFYCRCWPRQGVVDQCHRQWPES
jgi:hypothetical protein